MFNNSPFFECRSCFRRDVLIFIGNLSSNSTDQHRPVVGIIEMNVKKQHKAVVKETKTKWRNLKKAENREKFVEEIVKKKDEMMAGDWEKFAGEVRAVAEQVLGRTLGRERRTGGGMLKYREQCMGRG